AGEDEGREGRSLAAPVFPAFGRLRQRPVCRRNGDALDRLPGETATGIAGSLLTLKATKARAIERAAVSRFDRDCHRHGIAEFGRGSTHCLADAFHSISLIGIGTDLDDP